MGLYCSQRYPHRLSNIFILHIMQITEFEDHLTLVRQFIDRFCKSLSKFSVFDTLHYIVAIRLIKLNPLLVNLSQNGLITALDITMLQHIQGTGVHCPIQECLYLLSHLYRVFSSPQFHKNILYYVFRLFFAHYTRGIKKQVGIVLMEKEFINMVKVLTHNPIVILSGIAASLHTTFFIVSSSFHYSHSVVYHASAGLSPISNSRTLPFIICSCVI